MPVAYLSGYCVSATQLGLPDVGYLTMTEMLAAARQVSGAVGVPIIADGDDGYGNHLNAARLVRELERLGISGVQIEDQASPKRCGHMAGKRVIQTGKMLDKIKAAADARQDEDFVIITRTDAIAVMGFAEALARAAAYEEAGADAVFVEAPELMAQLVEIARTIRAPKVFNWAYGGRSPTPDAASIERLGYRFLLLPDVVFAVARTLSELYAEVRARGTYAGLADRMATFEQFNRLIGLDEVAGLDRRFGE